MATVLNGQKAGPGRGNHRSASTRNATRLLNPLEFPIALARPRRLTDITSWHEHIPFAFAIVDMARPRVFVELGTHKGDSYCAFCQAVDALGLSTKCYAVDTWEGDAQAGFYGPEVLSELRSHHDPLYGRFSRLIQSTGDDAVKHFLDKSVDLLHLDAFHTYEAVKHDFETWLPKLSDSGIVLLHDTNVREGDFGVWRLWGELQESHPGFELVHGHGLGVLAVGRALSPAIQGLFSLDDDARQRVRAFFASLGDRSAKAQQLQQVERALADQRDHAARLEMVIAKHEQQRAEFEKNLADQQARADRRESLLTDRQDRLHGLERILADQQAHAEHLDGIIADHTAQIRDRDTHISSLTDFERKVKGTLAYRIYRLLRLHKMYNRE